MKINNLTNGLVATLLLVSPIAGAETEYPASDFKPKVIYQDIDSSQSKSSSATVSTKQAKSVDADSKYPAADFEPKVVYNDADYKPSKSSETPMAAERSTISDAAVKVEEESMMSYLLGLVAFAVAGYLFFTKRELKAKASGSQVHSGQVSRLSGVARYLRKNNMGSVTGVAKYLESQVASIKGSTASSSVEKYLEKQAKSANEKSVQVRTGVEKYMRDRG